MKLVLISLVSFCLFACGNNHEGVSFELEMHLKSIKVSCAFLENNKFSKGYWVRSQLDGNGLLVITSTDKLNTYTLALMAHGQERALETRTIECLKL